jgi:hypothetical protein
LDVGPARETKKPAEIAPGGLFLEATIPHTRIVPENIWLVNR